MVRWVGSDRVVRLRRSRCGGVLSCALLAWLFVLGCGGDSSTPVGTVEGSIIPCNEGDASFDVWRADFDPTGKQTIFAGIDTLDGSTTAEFRLVVACDGEVVVDTTRGAACRNPPPPKNDGNPECPFDTIDVADLGGGPRIECLAEVTTTEPLDIGVGRCADPARADYTLRLQADTRALALGLVADDCRDDESCLEKQFGIDVDG